MNFFIYYSYSKFIGDDQRSNFHIFRRYYHRTKLSTHLEDRVLIEQLTCEKKQQTTKNYPSSHRLAMAAIQKLQRRPFTTTEYILPKTTYKNRKQYSKRERYYSAVVRRNSRGTSNERTDENHCLHVSVYRLFIRQLNKTVFVER